VSGLKHAPLASIVRNGYKGKSLHPSESVWNLNLDQIESGTGRILGKHIVKASELGTSTYQFEAGTVLYSKLRPYLNKVAIANEDGAATTELVPLRCDPEKILPKYLAYYLRAPRFLRFANVVVAGAKMPRMVMSEFWKHEIPLPPLEDQRRIAAILEKVDELRAKRRDALALLDSMAQSIFVDMFGDPKTNSFGWPVYEVGELADCIVPGRDKPKSFSGKIPWVTTEDLNCFGYTMGSRGGVGLTEGEIDAVRARVIPAGSVIMSCVGRLGVVSIAGTRMVVNQQLHSFQCGDQLDACYLMHYLPSQIAYMYSKATSTTLPYMNKGVCNGIPVMAPPINLQRLFSNKILEIDKMRGVHIQALDLLNELFSSLQDAAFLEVYQ